MTSAYIIHGRCDSEEYFSEAYPSLSNSHWLPWLQKQLLMRNILTQTPEMPRAYNPDYSQWRKHFEAYEIGAQSLLVGHSCGGGFLVRWLSENKVKVARTVLVAPWLDPEKLGCAPGFFDFSIDPELGSRTDLHIVASDNDMADIETSVKVIRAALAGATFHLMPGQGHFCFSDMNTAAFPALLEILVGEP